MNINVSFIKPSSLFSLILCGFVLLSTQSAMAQTKALETTEKPPLKHYDIEIILFKNLKVPKGNEKTLPSQAPLLNKKFISLANSKGIKSAAELDVIIPENNEFRLLDMAKKIKRSSRYKLLTHMVWRQPGLKKEDAIAIQIRTGKQFGNDYSSIDNPVSPIIKTPKVNENSEFKTLTLSSKNAAKSRNIKKVWYELEGKITITLARYLHAYVDLVLRVPNENTLEIDTSLETNDLKAKQATNLSFSSATLNNYAFKEHRRMRSRKLHYLDHPELGMLILITPYEAPTKIEFIDNLTLDKKT